MRKVLTGVFLGLFICWMACSKKELSPKAEQVKNYHLEAIDEAFKAVSKFTEAVKRNKSQAELQSLFLKARLAYKKTEFFTEYYNRLTARFINGAPIPEIDADDQHRITDPEGFQVIEPFIFPQYDKSKKKELLEESQRLISNVKRLQVISKTNYPTNPHVFDALRLEVFRVITLGISGFDAPGSQNSVNEAEAALYSIEKVLHIYEDTISNRDKFKECLKRVNSARVFLTKDSDFNSFNRLDFITDYANPLSLALLELAKEPEIGILTENRPLRANAPSLFDSNAFNPDFYIGSSDAVSTKEKTQLGKLLFFDPVLSGSGTRSCSSCHNPSKAFTDGVDKSFAISKNKKVLRNTPTVLNAALQPALFYDVRVAFLEDQAAEVINNKEEMHGSLQKAVEQLKNSKGYSKLFLKAFPNKQEPITEFTLKNAIGSYIRSLISLNSPFDKYVRGDRSQLNKNEINGFNLFMGKAKCGTCHFAPLFNGNVPPNFEKTETEIIGVPVSATINQIDTDQGKYNLRHLEMHRNAFRTPTVRNIALTAPYMHNGIYSTLDEVIDFYNKGGGIGIGIELENQTLPFDKLSLTDKEKKDIVHFLMKLTDTSTADQIPKELPALNSSSSKRKVLLTY